MLLAVTFFVVVVAATAVGTIADAHHIFGLSHLAALVAGASFWLLVGMLWTAYVAGVRGPSYARQVSKMVQAADAGQQVSGGFRAALRDVVPGAPLTRWKGGRVVITAGSVIWVRGVSNRATVLTGAECTGQRRLDRGYKDMTYNMPDLYKGEIIGVITLHANGADMELAAPAQLLEVLKYNLAKCPS
jgi:hypothetical protein